MFKFIKISFLLIILIDILNAQIHLDKTNLGRVCYCDPMKSTRISLNSKNIKKIDSATFTGLTSLQYLYLSSNQISFIDPATFTGLTSLQELRLQNNKINQIEEELFKGLSNLNEINLESNKIISFNKNALIGLSKLNKVCLYDNPISVQFPEFLSNICIMNPNCQVYILSSC